MARSILPSTISPTASAAFSNICRSFFCSSDEQKKLKPMFDNACDAAELIIDGKIDRAMNMFN